MAVDAVAAARVAVTEAWAERPEFGIVLGTGLGGLVDAIARPVVLPYESLPGWPTCTAPGHAGRLVCGELARRPVVVIDGRFHLYEGRSTAEATLPVRLLAALGAPNLILSNAAGGLHPRLRTGDLMAISDHINLQGRRGMLTRLPRQGNAVCYDPDLRQQALEVARREQITMTVGAYAAVTGPNYETRAEIRMLRRIGADVVGMSTVPEVLTAARYGLRTLALSTVTNVARPDIPQSTTSDEVVAVAHEAAPRLCRLVTGLLARGAV